jgi:hypothetical protein
MFSLSGGHGAGFFGCQFKTKECRGRAVFEACTVTVDIAGTGRNDFDHHSLPVTMASRNGDDNGIAQFEAGIRWLKKVNAHGTLLFSIAKANRKTRYADLSDYKEQ